jgi:DNA-binding CsgD family transcriptional regulator
MSENLLLAGQFGSVPPVFALRPGLSYVVGRSSKCDIILADIAISRQHADLAAGVGFVTVRDLGSRNGTFVDGQPILEETRVNIGRQLSFASLIFRLQECRPAGASEVGLESTMTGGEWQECDVNPRGPLAIVQQAGHRLTPAQEPVFRYLFLGKSEKEIARFLHLSPHTIHSHLKAIYAVFGVHSARELLAMFLPAPNRRQHNATIQLVAHSA